MTDDQIHAAKALAESLPKVTMFGEPVYLAIMEAREWLTWQRMALFADEARFYRAVDVMAAVIEPALTALPALCDEVLRLREELERLRALAFEACSLSDDAAFPRKDCDNFMDASERIREQARKK